MSGTDIMGVIFLVLGTFLLTLTCCIDPLERRCEDLEERLKKLEASR